MTTIIVNKNSKAGKNLLELAELLQKSGSKGIQICENKVPKNNIENSYNPKFVAMVKKAHNSKKRTEINPQNIWESIGL